MPNHPSREEELFHQALELPPGPQRDAFLQKACAGDETLREGVETLLHAHTEAGAVLEPLVPRPSPESATAPVTEKTGDKIGRYKLLQVIGEGGFGIVYMAEQQEPVRRRVALKIIKLGMDTKQVIARFEAERQALALMDHPNIAKVFDAGATETGRPFFVMELVRGVPITEYCDQNHLSTRQRLELFILVCKAIQHAHQKGVIHRDIKPSNVLVTLHDGVPVPKVIDFGIAKAIDQPLTEKTLFTRFEQFMGTPAYMSPEQAEMSALDVDTRTDIYALGVLLYELLSGKPPFDPDALVKSGIDAMRRTIREQDPVKPSTRLATLSNADLTTVAAQHDAEPRKLPGLVRGDLDWVVMKALEKDRTRRYDTANGLAMDIERHLRNEPIVARPPSNLYLFQKLVRRNKLLFAAASAVAVSLVIGLGVSTWLFLREKEARGRADTEARKSQQVAAFLEDMLKGVGPSVALGRDTTMLREILDKTAERVGKDLTNQPAVQAELCSTIGWAYWAIGQYPKSETMQREALALRRQLYGNEHLDVATSLDFLALALGRQTKYVEAEAAAREGLAIRRKILGDSHLDVAHSLIRVALVLREEALFHAEGQLPEAERLLRQALAIQRERLSDDHPDVAVTRKELGAVLEYERKPDEAEPLLREALAIQRKSFGNEHPDVADSLDHLADVLRDQGKLAEAEAMRRESNAMRRKLQGNEHPQLGVGLKNLAHILGQEGKWSEAEQVMREALAIRRKTYDNQHPFVLGDLTYLAYILGEEGRVDEALALYREAVESGDAQGLNDVAWAMATSETPEMRDGCSAVEYAERAVAATNRKDPNILDTLAAAYAEVGEFEKAIRVENEAMVLLKDGEAMSDYATHLKLYQSNLPYREHPDGQPAADTR
jgi:serine/threonine protein kinase/tetratricopeptide (TPR) repeat protein